MTTTQVADAGLKVGDYLVSEETDLFSNSAGNYLNRLTKIIEAKK